MHRSARLIAAFALTLCFVSAYADRGQIWLSAFPSMSAADGRSTVTISAEIRDSSGHLAPDGTRVLFKCDPIGSFRENIVQTTNGVARAILVAGGSPGTTSITAAALIGDYQPSTLEFEFVADRSQLSSQFEYIELVTPGFMQYCAENRIMEASAPTEQGQGKAASPEYVSVKYRDITVRAEDIQLNIPAYEVRARHAIVRIGKGPERKYAQLYLKLNQHKGYGMTTFLAPKQIGISIFGRGFDFLTEADDGTMRVATRADWAERHERYGLVEIKGQDILPAKTTSGASLFAFQDTSTSISTISAKKAVVFPNKVIQFQRAEVMVNGTKVLRMPLYQLSLNQGGQIVMNNLVSVNNSQLALDYPYYLSLKPGQTSLLRLQTGNSYGSGVSSNHGVYLGYEMGWNHGDDMQGGLSFTGLGRNDWSIVANQYLKIDDRSSISGQIQVPQGQSIFGSAGANRSFNGFETSLSGSASHILRGIQYNSSDYSFVAEKDPIKVGKLPFQMFLGLTAIQSSNSLIGSSQEGAGARMRLQSNSIRIDRWSSLTTSATISQLSGRNTATGLTTLANATVNRRFGSVASVLMSYDYTRDGYNDRYLGHNRFSLQSFFNKGPFRLSLMGSKSLDVAQQSLYADMSLRLSKVWRIGYGYTFDQYLDTRSLDFNFVLGYTIGGGEAGREVGLIWSRSTGRIGFELLGATF